MNISVIKVSNKGKPCIQNGSKPRGKCVIINNVSEEVAIESKRFRYIFEKLHFQVDECYDLNATQMTTKLKTIAAEADPLSQAFVAMIISHGLDEKVLGSDACKTIRAMKAKAKQHAPKPKQQEVVKSDTLAKPIVTQTAAQPDRTNFPQMLSLDEKWVENNQDTYVCYSCAEGHKTFYRKNSGMTYFGQALSHSIAQYACEESLSSIMSRVMTKTINIKLMAETNTSGTDNEIGMNAMPVRNRQSADNNSTNKTTSSDGSTDRIDNTSPATPPPLSATDSQENSVNQNPVASTSRAESEVTWRGTGAASVFNPTPSESLGLDVTCPPFTRTDVQLYHL
ncbi:unnamed protein product [Medioppia subpectinata]|uniref:Caspase family p20 domain-containing protein n=1 Tax=Medioppia subpectinata TaxID=1979941 RepID=A0A7R9KK36_9ACAR|nr:unnamed protein product [Medioppia subpectinata]CAG2105033.1 unnamed protein product [Medioppia subpectinata]